MKSTQRKVLRCAIYTRKSTEHNLDLEFNSLHAQREACEAYIKSQAHEGWRLIRERYDDGAFSGASLDRPALQALLTELRSGRIDIIVVYKVDRLTRSLADFAKLVELFDQHSVSFVSVTQSFNTTSSMGRLTLNVLLSFAQFEREVIGERVRDKIAASKRKGLWVGGPVPLGYASIGKKLVVQPQEAETVRSIFRRYLELGSVGALAQDLDRCGVRTKQRPGGKGNMGGGVRFGVGTLAYLLKNRLYVGEISYRGEVHRGEHEPILDRDLFDAVQAKLKAGAVTRRLRLKASSAILAGRIYDDRGNRMSPTHANKLGVRYRYYVSQAVVQGRRADAGSVPRVSAPEIETRVLDAVRRHIESAGSTGGPVTLVDESDLIERYVHRVIVRPQALEVCLVPPGEVSDQADSSDVDADDNVRSNTTMALPWTAKTFVALKGIVHSPVSELAMSPENRDALLVAIAKARRWVEDIRLDRVGSFEEIADHESRGERYVRQLASLAFISPCVVAAIVEGSLSTDLTVSSLAKMLPHSWAEQEQRVGLAR
ncbi:MAG: recombinase family protein [Xanthobacteraceae bacterium]